MTCVLVTDASVVVDLLARFKPAPIETALFAADTYLAAPELLDVEVLQTLRKLEAAKAIPAGRRLEVIDDFRALRIRRYRHAALWEDMWQLRKNLTAYDGCFVALARQLEATLVTRDRRLARAPGAGIDIELL